MKNILIRVFLSAITATSFGLSVTQPVNFDNDPVGEYDSSPYITFKADWEINPPNSLKDSGHLFIMVDTNKASVHHNVMQLTYFANQYEASSGMAFNAPIYCGNDYCKYTHLFLQYDIRFDSGFDWNKGGKLPGLASYPDSPTGCIDNSTFNGFTARRMWGVSGMGYSYIYNPTKLERCGDYFALQESNGSIILLGTNKWYTLTQEVTLNDIGSTNGNIREWINGVLVRELKNIVLRKTSDVYINQVKMDSFFGGSNIEWAPATEQHAYFDNFVVSETNPFDTYPALKSKDSYVANRKAN